MPRWLCLQGGGIWCDPGAQALQLDATRREFFDLLVGPLAAAVMGGQTEFADSELFSPDTEEYRGFTARLEHEIDHIRYHLSTSYGLAHFGLETWIGDVAIEAVVDRVRRGANEPLPLFTADFEAMARARPRFGPGGTPNSIIDDETGFRVACFSLEELLRLLDGVPERFEAGAAKFGASIFLGPNTRGTRRIVGTALQEMMSRFRPSAELVAISGFRDPWMAYLMGRRFGAWQLLEGLGFLAETEMSAELRLGPGPAWTEMSTQLQYTQMLGFCLRTSGVSREEFFRLIPAIRAVGELALWIPLGPDGLVSGDKGTVEWDDFHPGWRFIKAWRAFCRDEKRVKASLSIEYGDHVDESGRWQDSIADELGWCRVERLLDAWIDVIENSGEALKSFFLLPEKALGQRIRTSGKLLKEYKAANREWNAFRHSLTAAEQLGLFRVVLCGDTDIVLPVRQPVDPQDFPERNEAFAQLWLLRGAHLCMEEWDGYGGGIARHGKEMAKAVLSQCAIRPGVELERLAAAVVRHFKLS